MTTNDVKKNLKLYQQNIIKIKHRPNIIETDKELHQHNFPIKARKSTKIKKMLNVLLILQQKAQTTYFNEQLKE